MLCQGVNPGITHKRQTVKILNGQTMPALGPTTVYYSLPGLGLHSVSETVGTMTLYIARLKSSFAHDLTLKLIAGISV
jgi:hypothetical protein